MAEENVQEAQKAETFEPSRKNKVAIVGFAPSWREAPFADSNTEIWCLNEMYRIAREVPAFRADKWFEIHDRNSASKATAEHVNFLRNGAFEDKQTDYKYQFDGPIFMWDHFDDLPQSVKFPKDEIINTFGTRGFQGSGYFTNSISWMVAFALAHGKFVGVNVEDKVYPLYIPRYEEVLLYGVDMAQDSEYGWQRPSCEYWIGISEGLGVKFKIPPTSDLLKCTQLYGYESNNRNRVWLKTQAKELGKRADGLEQQRVLMEHNLMMIRQAQAEHRGAQQAYKEILKRTQ